MRRFVLAAAVTLCALLSGCVTLPDHGPVVSAGQEGTVDDNAACCYIPNPPQPGESASDIVQHFLEAMTATPFQTSVARQFLTASAQAAWHPEQATLIYGGDAAPRGETQVSVTLSEAYQLDARGAYAGSLDPLKSTLLFRMEFEDREWRIASLPNALIVPQSWVEANYDHANVYYFDPTAQILVPEPVLVPRGEEFATALTKSLLAGPGPDLGNVARNFFPQRLPLGLSVPVDADGVADVALQGDASAMTPEESRLAAVQLAWTLRQDPAIRTLQITADDQTLPGLTSIVDVNDGAEYDPSAFAAASSMFALRDGELVTGKPSSMTPVEGPLGRGDYGVTSFGVSMDTSRVAAVVEDGTTLLLASTHDPDEPVQVGSRAATDLLKPVWDFDDRVWVVDRTSSGAQVSFGSGERIRTVDAPGITGQDVRSFLVSRDGSRLVAVVRKARRDVIMVARIEHNDQGRVLSIETARRLPWPSEDRPRIRDIAWRTTTSIAVLYPVRDLVQVRSLLVDGTPANLNVVSSTLAGDFRWLAGSPVVEEDLFASSRSGFSDLAEADRTSTRSSVDLRTLTYVG